MLIFLFDQMRNFREVVHSILNCFDFCFETREVYNCPFWPSPPPPSCPTDDVIGSTLAMDTSILLRCTCSPILSRAPRTRLRPAWGVICSVPHTIVSYSLSWMFENPKTSNVPDSCQRLRSVLGETLTILPISVHENPKRRSSESRGLPWLPLLGLEMFHLRLQTLCFL